MVEVMTDKATVEIRRAQARPRRQACSPRRGGARRQCADHDSPVEPSERPHPPRSGRAGPSPRRPRHPSRDAPPVRVWRGEFPSRASGQRCDVAASGLATPATRNWRATSGSTSGRSRARAAPAASPPTTSRRTARAAPGPRLTNASSSRAGRCADSLPGAAPEDRRAAGAVEADGAACHLRRGD